MKNCMFWVKFSVKNCRKGKSYPHFHIKMWIYPHNKFENFSKTPSKNGYMCTTRRVIHIKEGKNRSPKIKMNKICTIYFYAYLKGQLFAVIISTSVSIGVIPAGNSLVPSITNPFLGMYVSWRISFSSIISPFRYVCRYAFAS